MKTRPALAAAVAGLVLVTTTAAHAAGPPYTVAVGGNTSGTYTVHASSFGPVTMTFKNNNGTIINMGCTSITMTGSVTAGAGKNPVATITSNTWSGCTMPGGAATFTQMGTWNLYGTGSNATAASTDSIAGNIGNVHLEHKLTAAPAICSFTITGHMDTTFKESTQQLVINETGFSGDLTLSNVGPCLGQWQNGNAMDLSATLNVSTTGGAINLS